MSDVRIILEPGDSVTIANAEGTVVSYVEPYLDQRRPEVCDHCGEAVEALPDDHATFPGTWKHARGLFGCEDGEEYATVNGSDQVKP